MEKLILNSIQNIILKLKNDGIYIYPDRCRNITAILDMVSDSNSEVFFDKLTELFEIYSNAVKNYPVTYGHDMDMLKRLSSTISQFTIKVLPINKKIPVKYRGVIILKDIDSGIFTHELQLLISKVISNKFVIINYDDRFEITLEDELEALADEALKALISFV